jgi:hypothetical protein
MIDECPLCTLEEAKVTTPDDQAGWRFCCQACGEEWHVTDQGEITEPTNRREI